VDAFATIQAGINALAEGGTVNVAAGTYTENVTVNKQLTLDGAGSGSGVGDTILQSAAANTPVMTIRSRKLIKVATTKEAWYGSGA
jgi:pectin methylesterase-like acyl-CoA thioesterase